jgi:hypothetical protein
MRNQDSVSRLRLVVCTPFFRELNGESFESKISSIESKEEKKV